MCHVPRAHAHLSNVAAFDLGMKLPFGCESIGSHVCHCKQWEALVVTQHCIDEPESCLKSLKELQGSSINVLFHFVGSLKV